MAAAAGAIKRTSKGTFVKGQKGISPGRPKSSRNKLAECFIQDVQTLWSKHGEKVLEKMLKVDPVAFARLAATLVPKEFKVDGEIREIKQVLIDFTGLPPLKHDRSRVLIVDQIEDMILGADELDAILLGETDAE